MTAPHSGSDEIEKLISDKYDWVDEGFKLRSKSGPESPKWVMLKYEKLNTSNIVISKKPIKRVAIN